VPFLVGGSPLYVRAVVEGLRIPAVPPNPALRAELEAVAAEEGDGVRRCLALAIGRNGHEKIEKPHLPAPCLPVTVV